METGGGDFVWWRKERNSVTGEIRWAVRQRQFILTGRSIDGVETGIPGGFGEIVGTYDTLEGAVERTDELIAAMSWEPAWTPPETDDHTILSNSDEDIQ